MAEIVGAYYTQCISGIADLDVTDIFPCFFGKGLANNRRATTGYGIGDKIMAIDLRPFHGNKNIACCNFSRIKTYTCNLQICRTEGAIVGYP